MTLRAGNDRVLIIPDESDSVTSSGLIVTFSKKQNPTTGVITSIGLAVDSSMEGIEVGDRVFFKDMAGAEFTHEGQLYYCLFYSEILGVESK